MYVCIFFFLRWFQWWIVGTLASVTGGVWYAVESVNASDLKAQPSHLPWTHKDLIRGFDHARSVLCFYGSNNVKKSKIT